MQFSAQQHNLWVHHLPWSQLNQYISSLGDHCWQLSGVYMTIIFHRSVHNLAHTFSLCSYFPACRLEQSCLSITTPPSKLGRLSKLKLNNLKEASGHKIPFSKYCEHYCCKVECSHRKTLIEQIWHSSQLEWVYNWGIAVCILQVCLEQDTLEKIRLVNKATSLFLLNLETAILDGSFALEQPSCSIFSRDHTHTTTRSLDS